MFGLFKKPPLWKEACEYARRKPYNDNPEKGPIWACGQFARLLLDKAEAEGIPCALVIVGDRHDRAHAIVEMKDGDTMWYVDWKGGPWPGKSRRFPKGFIIRLNRWRQHGSLQIDEDNKRV